MLLVNQAPVSSLLNCYTDVVMKPTRHNKRLVMSKSESTGTILSGRCLFLQLFKLLFSVVQSRIMLAQCTTSRGKGIVELAKRES